MRRLGLCCLWGLLGLLGLFALCYLETQPLLGCLVGLWLLEWHYNSQEAPARVLPNLCPRKYYPFPFILGELK